LFCVVLCIVCFVSFYVLFVLCRSMYCLFCVVLRILCVHMCTVLLSLGGYPVAAKYIIYHNHILSHNFVLEISQQHVLSFRRWRWKNMADHVTKVSYY